MSWERAEWEQAGRGVTMPRRPVGDDGSPVAAVATLTAGEVRYQPLMVATFPEITVTLTTLTVEIETPGGPGETLRLAVYEAPGWQPGTLVCDVGEVDVATPGRKEIACGHALPPGPVLVAMNSDGAPTLRGWAAVAPTGPAGAVLPDWRAPQTYGPMPATGTAPTTAGGPFVMLVTPEVSDA